MIFAVLDVSLIIGLNIGKTDRPLMFFTLIFFKLEFYIITSAKKQVMFSLCLLIRLLKRL